LSQDRVECHVGYGHPSPANHTAVMVASPEGVQRIRFIYS
jgi:hypothetical protein